MNQKRLFIIIGTLIVVLVIVAVTFLFLNTPAFNQPPADDTDLFPVDDGERDIDNQPTNGEDTNILISGSEVVDSKAILFQI